MTELSPENVNPTIEDLTVTVNATVTVPGDAMRLNNVDPTALVLGASRIVGAALDAITPVGSTVRVEQASNSAAAFTVGT